MVNLQRWLRHNSPHLVVAGSILLSGLSGCRTTHQAAVTLEPAYSGSGAEYAQTEPLAEPSVTPPANSPPASSPSASSPLASTPPASGPPAGPPQSGTPCEGIPTPGIPYEETEAERTKAGRRTVGPPLEPPEPVDLRPLSPETTAPSETAASGTSSSSTAASSDSSPSPEQAPSPPFADSGSGDAGSDSRQTILESAEPPTIEPTDVPPFAADPAEDRRPPVVPVPEEATQNARSVTRDEKTPGESPASVPASEGSELPEFIDDVPSNEDQLPNREVPVPAPSSNTRDQSDGEPDQPDFRDASPGGGGGASPLELDPSSKHGNRMPSDGDAQAAGSEAGLPEIRPDVAQQAPAPQTEVLVNVLAEFDSPIDSVTVGPNGDAFVSQGDRISRVAPNGVVTDWAKVGAPRGHILLPDGDHAVCDASQRAIVRLDPDGNQIEKIATRSEGYFLRSPNDLVADEHGGIYFTDPGYARIQNAIGKVHYAAPDGTVRVVARRLAFPEGIALSPDGDSLFVVESQTNQVLKFSILSPGQVGPKRVFARLSESDPGQATGFANGMAVDPAGRVFVAHEGTGQVEEFAADGLLLQRHRLDAPVSSVTIDPRDFSRLFAAGASRTGLSQNGNSAGRLFEIQLSE